MSDGQETIIEARKPLSFRKLAVVLMLWNSMVLEINADLTENHDAPTTAWS
jgi:hypothetical protein